MFLRSINKCRKFKRFEKATSHEPQPHTSYLLRKLPNVRFTSSQFFAMLRLICKSQCIILIFFQGYTISSQASFDSTQFSEIKTTP